jgi:hypothetical protein
MNRQQRINKFAQAFMETRYRMMASAIEPDDVDELSDAADILSALTRMNDDDRWEALQLLTDEEIVRLYDEINDDY